MYKYNLKKNNNLTFFYYIKIWIKVFKVKISILLKNNNCLHVVNKSVSFKKFFK